MKTSNSAPESSPKNDSARAFAALGEAYSKALNMLPPERQKVWAEKIANRRMQPNRPQTRPLARDEIRGSTSRGPLAR